MERERDRAERETDTPGTALTNMSYLHETVRARARAREREREKERERANERASETERHCDRD